MGGVASGGANERTGLTSAGAAAANNNRMRYTDIQDA